MTEGQRQLDTRAIEIATAAQQAWVSHEKICEVRQVALIAKFNDSKADRDAFRTEVAVALREIRGVIIKSAIALISGLLLTVAYFLQHNGLPGAH